MAGEVGHRRVAEENFGSREGKRQARHGEPVLSQRSPAENAERLRRTRGKGQRLIKSEVGGQPARMRLPAVGSWTRVRRHATRAIGISWGDRPLTPDSPPPDERTAALVRALKRYRSRLARKLEAIRGDLAEAERAPEFRRFGEALLSYLRQVPARASNVTLPDPADHGKSIEIELDPNLNGQGNAQRYFKRAAKGERGLSEIPPRVARTEREIRALTELLSRTEVGEASPDAEPGQADPELLRDLEAAFSKIPSVLRESVGAARLGPKRTPIAKGEIRAPSSRLQPRRLKTSEGWDVLIGRSNEGNDYLTHKLARSEDYWFHVHGAAGSHVVLRRGKGKDEPSKQTLVEVAAWAAFYSQARTAGKVPVIYTRKKYVRKPRGGKPGLAVCEREKTVMVRPEEPEKTSLAESENDLEE